MSEMAVDLRRRYHTRVLSKKKKTEVVLVTSFLTEMEDHTLIDLKSKPGE